MSSQILLESILNKLKATYPPGMSDDDLFELYCADNLLSNYDLDNTEIETGIVDGSRDAGIDSAYVFVNRRLLTEDFDFSSVKQPVEVELYLIQSKNQDTFKESPVDKLSASLPLLLDPAQNEVNLVALFRPSVVKITRSFIGAMKELAGEFPKVVIRIAYCCKGTGVNDVIKAKEQSLVTILKSKFPNVEFNNYGAQKLYDRSGKQKRLVRELATVGTPLSGDNSYVALCRLREYIGMISDENGEILNPVFESNVRAFQGEVEVNREIASSIATPVPGVDFWWLNNGVSVVADQAQFMNNKLIIENPLVVNGLQTSHVLHESIDKIAADDKRMVLVRVIVEKDREKRDEIIRATNRQTNIKHSSFRATEPIH
jgi:AIPR protein